jgi:phosphoribosylglycinamide formyltransferase 1
MRILSDDFVDRFEGKIINVHPSLLPKFAGGMDCDVHEEVIKSGEKTTGCTVHIVSKIVDGGQILLQKSCEVLHNYTPETLKARVQELEGNALVEVIAGWIN